MGDHRADIKIKFWFHNKTYKYDAWINYSPDSDGLDNRVVEFFRESYEDGIRRYDELVAKDEEKRNREFVREKELAELKRLKLKYEKS